MESVSSRCTVWLSGDPHFSLVCSANRSTGVVCGDTPHDLQAFRPDPRKVLRGDMIYPATVTFVEERSSLGGKIKLLRQVKVKIDGTVHVFTKVR